MGGDQPLGLLVGGEISREVTGWATLMVASPLFTIETLNSILRNSFGDDLREFHSDLAFIDEDSLHIKESLIPILSLLIDLGEGSDPGNACDQSLSPGADHSHESITKGLGRWKWMTKLQ